MVEKRRTEKGATLDLERYTPAYFTSIANKLSHGASTHYLKSFGIGIEAWRAIAIIASYGEASASEICQFSGMDKGPVSRVLKAIHAKGLIAYRTDPDDSRVRFARLTEKGEKLHQLILQYALHREQVFLSVLTRQEQEAFVNILQRLRLNMPRVDALSAEYVEEHWRSPGKRG